MPEGVLHLFWYEKTPGGKGFGDDIIDNKVQ